MNIQDIEESIVQLENAQTTFSNAFKLSALYIIRNNMKHGLKVKSDAVESELKDILPQYRHYVAVRKEHQQGKTTDAEIMTILELLCIEVKEFLQALYASTTQQKERDILINTIKNLQWDQ